MNKKKPRGYTKRTKEQREHDLLFCSDLFLKGYQYRQIAEALNKKVEENGWGYKLSFQMVYYDIQHCLVEWKRERLDTIDDYISQELKKLDKLEQEAWQAWEVSKGGKERTKNRMSIAPRKVLSEEEQASVRYGYDETMNESSAGNPRFLDLLLNIQQRRAKMLGYDAPLKVQLPGLDKEDEKPGYNVSAIPDDLLFAVADKLQSAEYVKAMSDKPS